MKQISYLKGCVLSKLKTNIIKILMEFLENEHTRGYLTKKNYASICMRITKIILKKKKPLKRDSHC